MISVYIAGKYLAQERLRHERERLRGMGYECDSFWLDQPETSYAITPKRAYDEALRDLDNLQRAEWIILDTLDESNTGGREVELGTALERRMWFIRIGPIRNIFHHLANEAYHSWDEFFADYAPVTMEGSIG